MKNLESRYRFFRENAGGVVGESAVTAIALARAELRAEELELVALSGYEQEFWDGEEPAPKHVIWIAIYKPEHIDRHGEPVRGCYCLAQLGMIGLDSLDDPYLRVVKAELFCEALSEIDKESVEYAQESAERASYAAGAPA